MSLSCCNGSNHFIELKPVTDFIDVKLSKSCVMNQLDKRINALQKELNVIISSEDSIDNKIVEINLKEEELKKKINENGNENWNKKSIVGKANACFKRNMAVGCIMIAWFSGIRLIPREVVADWYYMGDTNRRQLRELQRNKDRLRILNEKMETLKEEKRIVENQTVHTEEQSPYQQELIPLKEIVVELISEREKLYVEVDQQKNQLLEKKNVRDNNFEGRLLSTIVSILDFISFSFLSNCSSFLFPNKFQNPVYQLYCGGKDGVKVEKIRHDIQETRNKISKIDHVIKWLMEVINKKENQLLWPDE